jgi:hypothetical protein
MLRRIFAMRSLSRATRHDQTNRHRRTWSAKSSTSLDDHNHRVQHWRKSDAAEMDHRRITAMPHHAMPDRQSNTDAIGAGPICDGATA